MDILDEVVNGPQQDISLDTLFPPVQEGLRLPAKTMKNRAATTALLGSDPKSVVANYSLLMTEQQEGKDDLGKIMRQSIDEKNKKLDIQGVMSVLSDSSIPFERKQQIVTQLNESSFLKDHGNLLFTQSLAKPSKGETKEAEVARLSASDAIREIYEARTRVQGIVNAHGATLSGDAVGGLAGMLELYVMPFGNNVNIGKLNSALNKDDSFWSKFKGYLGAGTTTANLRNRLESLPPAKRPEFAKLLVDTIKANSGIVFSNDNQFAQYDKAVALLEEGGYSNTQMWLDNIAPLFDLIGIGQFVRGLGNKTLKKATTKGVTTVPQFDKAAPKKQTYEEALASERTAKQKEATDAIEKQWAFDPDKPTPDTPHVPTPPSDGVSTLLGGTGLRPREPTRQRAALFKPRTPEDEVDRVNLNSVTRETHPSSPAEIFKQANPEQARATHAAVVNSTTDELAEALAGTTRTQAITNDVVPQVGTPSGAVTTHPVDIQRNLRRDMNVPDDIVNAASHSGGIYFTPEEKAQARARVVNDFGNASGLRMVEPMSSFMVDGSRINIAAVYGTLEGSFSDPIQAIRQARLALRQYGILDEEITLLRKEGLDHVPVNMTDELPDGPGNYLIRVDTKHTIDPTDITRLETFDVKRNLFDRIRQFISEHVGSLTRNLFDPASLLHPIYTDAASVVSDVTSKFDKLLYELAAEYADKFNKLSKERKAEVENYLKEANFNEIKFDLGDLTARGFNAAEIDAIRSWRKFWDGHFYLENLDLIRTLNGQGYQLFKNGNTELFAKRIEKNQNLGTIYDPEFDALITHTKAEGDALYDAGGHYARLRRPVEINGVMVDHILVRNNPNNYLRKFRDTDRVLNYRHGYFQIQYKAPRFVDELGADGKAVRTIAVAGDWKEAQTFADRMSQQSDKKYKVRGDERALRRDDDAWWDLASASGRIAQRQRGKLLEDGSGLNHLGDHSYIVSPVDAAIRASRSIAGRTIARPMLEAAKARFMNQYKDILPGNGMGGVRYPRSLGEIGGRGEQTSKQVADARTTYEYINYLENGYINNIDDAFKAAMNATADMLGRKGFSTAERAFTQFGDAAPVSLSKNTVFMAYIGTNILRQLIIQPHQVMRTWAYNPKGWLTGSIQKYVTEFVGDRMGITTKSGFAKFIDYSGLLQSVDKQNLVRGALTEAADSTNKAVRYTSRALNVPRKLGFDLGEQMNMLGHAAAVFDRYKRKGFDVFDKAVQDKMISEIRAISYEMNFAGDMAYNQTSLAIMLQFMQVPHKALLQLTNRKLDVMTRTRLLVGDLLMWGPPTALVANTFGEDVLPNNPELRELFLWGAEAWAINAALTELTGEKQGVDLSSLAPYDMTGWKRFFEAMYTGGIHDVVLNSPAGQLFFKDGSRFHMAVQSMGRVMGMVEDDDESPETALDVIENVMKISSGFNNAIKAKLLLDSQKRLDQIGMSIDDKVTKVEAWAQLLGFGTADTRDLYAMSIEMSKDIKSAREDWDKVYDEVLRYYAQKLQVENVDDKFVTKVTGRLLKTFEDNPAALAHIRNRWAKDMMGKEAQLFDTFLKRAGIPNLGGLEDQVKQMPVSDADKERMLGYIQDMKNVQSQMKENK